MRSILRPGLSVILIVAAALPTFAAGDVPPPPSTPTSSLEAIRDLVRQQAALLDEIERMRTRVDGLVRVVREQEGGDSEEGQEIADLLGALDSDDYQSRVRATDALRRTLVDRLWLLIERPELTPEGQRRVKGLLSEASAMIGLTNVAVDLEPAHRDVLWTLLDDEPDWVLAALGDDPERIRHALQNRPPDHELATEVVLASIIRNDMRPVAREIAVNEIHDVSGGLLRRSMLDLLQPGTATGDPAARTFAGYREQAAVRAMRTLARRPSPDLVARILATLQGAPRWNVRYELFLVETLLNIGATEAIGPLHEIAEEKRKRLSGSYRGQGMELKPGDCELIAAALLLELDLGELDVVVSDPRNFREPQYRGFEPPDQESPEREAAYAAVRQAIETSGPFPSLPEYERLRHSFDE